MSSPWFLLSFLPWRYLSPSRAFCAATICSGASNFLVRAREVLTERHLERVVACIFAVHNLFDPHQFARPDGVQLALFVVSGLVFENSVSLSRDFVEFVNHGCRSSCSMSP